MMFIAIPLIQFFQLVTQAWDDFKLRFLVPSLAHSCHSYIL